MKKIIRSIVVTFLMFFIPLNAYSIEDLNYSKEYSNVEKNKVKDYKNEDASDNSDINKVENFKLEKKTEKEYEIVLAKKNGDYLFLDSDNDLKIVIKKFEKFKKDKKEDENIVIIDKSGRIKYSDLGMARIIKYINGQVDPTKNNNTNIYKEKELKNEYTYMNHRYIDDVPIKSYSENSIEIEVSGYTGWVNNNTISGNYDCVIVPLNQVKNPSYYYLKNGEMYHFLSENITSENKDGYSISNGKAPSFFKENIKYYSYDGKYFYKSLKSLILDLQKNNHNNSINKNNPYYNYYQYLPFRSKSRFNENEINKFINDNTEPNSKLRNIGKDLIDIQNKYGVNATLILGVAINESNWGTSIISQEKNNIFGIKAYDKNPNEDATKFSSVRECIEEFSKNYISKGYSDPFDYRYFGGFLGNKNLGANVKYASDPYWGEKATRYANLLDFTISTNKENLKGNNYYQLGIVSGINSVYDNKNNEVYKINDEKKKGNGIIGSTFIVNDLRKITIGNKISYNINSERTSPVIINGSLNRFSGIYDWNKKYYIEAKNVNLINKGRNIEDPDTVNESGVKYQVHGENYGWTDEVKNGKLSGTVGQSKRIEGIKINLFNKPSGLNIEYRGKIQGKKDMERWHKNGELLGTTGQSKRLEKLQIILSGNESDKYSVKYRAHIQDIGWTPWSMDGDIVGENNKRIEAIEIYLDSKKDLSIKYQSSIEDYGIQPYVNNGKVSGTTGKAKNLEEIKIKLINNPNDLKVVYKPHIQDIGWGNWKKNNEIAGVKNKRLEAIIIKLEGYNSKKYKMEYRVHVEDKGWLPWTKAGEIAGTVGECKSIEAIQIKINKV